MTSTNNNNNNFFSTIIPVETSNRSNQSSSRRRRHGDDRMSCLMDKINFTHVICHSGDDRVFRSLLRDHYLSFGT